MAHGVGLEFDTEASRSEAYQGAYGRICPKLAAWKPKGVPERDLDAYFRHVAEQRMIEAPGVLPGTIATSTEQRQELEQKFASTIPAGYTYFGQFVDHDITFDPTPLRMRRNDPKGIRNFRTPRLDLDSVYGRGPEDQPYLYDQESFNDNNRKLEKLLIGQVTDSPLRDLPRNSQDRALIGDARNDENAIVSQLHLAFLLAHNTLVDRARDRGEQEPFEAARRTLGWLYQYIVWNDFLRRVTGKAAHDRALQLVDAGNGKKKCVLGLEQIYNWDKQAFLPVEFSAAAYRFGHSMVRNEYQTSELRGSGRFVPLFDASGADDLRGRRAMKQENVIQWSWFLKMWLPEGQRDKFPQMARKIDTKLSNALAYMPAEAAPRNVLAYRNLTRGCSYGLPAGTAVAEAYKRVYEDLGVVPVDLEDGEPDALWYYILREAERTEGGNKLGPLGSAIVCAIFASLLKSDPNSYISNDPAWTPNDDPLLCPGMDNRDGDKLRDQDPDRDRSWTLASIIRISGLPVVGQDIDEQRQGSFKHPLCRG